MLRVNEMEELFDAAATLSRSAPQHGDRLAIVTNGGGAGVLATDRLIEEGGHLATLDAATIDKLNAVLPPTWSHANPVDIIGDADAERYAKAVGVLMQDAGYRCAAGRLLPDRDRLLGGRRQGPDRRAGASAGTRGQENVFACWMGDASVREGRAALVAAKLPDYETPERAVRAFMYLVRYRQSQDLLLETPASRGADARRPISSARAGLIRAGARR